MEAAIMGETQGMTTGARTRAGLLLAAISIALIVFGAAAQSASAAFTHPYATEWSTGSNCEGHDIANDAQGNLYVMCAAKNPNGLWGSVRKFSPTGVPIPFSSSKPYVEGNEINEDPAAPLKSFGGHAYIDVDTSSARPGWIYVSDNYTPQQDPPGGGPSVGASSKVDIFNPTGEYVTSIAGDFTTGVPTGVGVDDKGFVYVMWQAGAGTSHISKYDPSSYREIERMILGRGIFYAKSGYLGPCCLMVRPDSSGAVWAGWGDDYFDRVEKFGKYEPDQWSTDLRSGNKNPEAKIAAVSPFLVEAFPEEHCPELFEASFSDSCELGGESFNTYFDTNELYDLSLGGPSPIVTPYTEGNAVDPVHANGPQFGEGHLQYPLGGPGGEAVKPGLTVDDSGNVWVISASNKIVKFSKGAILPEVVTRKPSLTELGHYTATVHALVKPAGGGPVTECRVSYGLFGKEKIYNNTGSPATCAEPTPYPDGSDVPVSAQLTNLEPGKKYRYHAEVANANGGTTGVDRVLEARAVLDVETDSATEVGRNAATLNGQLDADGIPTEYWYQWGPTTQYGQTTLDAEGKGISVSGPPGEQEQVPYHLVHIQAGHTYHFRLVARNELGLTFGSDQSFRTVSPPEISGVGAEKVTETSADLHALINPVGYPTTYVFEYGKTPTYGSTLPVSDNELTGTTPQKVEIHLSDLPAGTTIHYRVVATNEWGTTATDDTTFNFRPADCPNAHVRQVTGSSYLPDCRAYELVTPGYAGAVQFLPGEALKAFGTTFVVSNVVQTPQNFGYASNPPRFEYWGGLGAINGIDTPNSFIDVYMATRTPTGWVTSMPGLKGNETKFTWGRTCSETLAVCADHIGPLYVKDPETGTEKEVPKSDAPVLYRYDGTRLGRLPSNVNVIPDGSEFQGDWMFSGNFNHFIFSTQTRFTPDGVGTLPGSVYDNDIAKGTLEVISKDKAGNNIAAEPIGAGIPKKVTGIVSVSKDGSHVLMAGTTNQFCDVNAYPYECPHALASPVRLYMRDVPAKITYEVSREKEVNYVGATADGGKVFFTSNEQLIPGTGPGQDNDSSRDLYMWEENGDKLKLISREGALGNDDECEATWVAKCGVLPLTPETADISQNFELKTYVQGIDDVLARDSGAIYFYSPEDLDPTEVGGDGQRNLYVYRDGKIHLVGTLEPNAQVERSTISQDGSHAAFLTASSLTSYDAHGQREVYVYDANTGVLRCASCNPNGKAPMVGQQVITVAEAGPFMSDDGRVFFGTKESLVPQDSDGIRDIYEYVGGRPQLISSGTGNRENTGGLETVAAFFGVLQVGLESVSRDGTDVYFGSFETLTPEDKNGSFLKFYDARTGGGFDFNPDLGPCAAADECHGVSSQRPASAQLGTGATVGDGGNLPEPAKHHGKKHRKKKRHRRHSEHRGGHRNG
jgi:hypothetical protein